MTKQEYEDALRALLQPSPEMERLAEGMKTIVSTTYPNLFRPFREGQIHPCELCGVVCKVASSWAMEQHSAPCGAMCGRGLYHGANPHFATSCPSCNPKGSVKGDSIQSE